MLNKRYNVFSKIHKGLRLMLYDTATKLQKMDTSGAAADETVQQLKETLSFFDTHAEHEDAFILPHISRYHPEMVDELEQEHDIDHQLSQELDNLVKHWEATQEIEVRSVIIENMLLTFHEFIAFNLYHMNKEESALLMALWQHYSDEEIIGMEEQIVQAIDPELLMLESRWMMRSINNQEIIEWLGGIRRNAPAPVFQHFMQMAKEEISIERQQVVEQALAVYLVK